MAGQGTRIAFSYIHPRDVVVLGGLLEASKASGCQLRLWQLEKQLDEGEHVDPADEKVVSVIGLTRPEEETAKLQIAESIIASFDARVRAHAEARARFLQARIARRKRAMGARARRMVRGPDLTRRNLQHLVT